MLCLSLTLQMFLGHVADMYFAVLRTTGHDTWDIFKSDAGDLWYYLLGEVFTSSSYRKLSTHLTLYSGRTGWRRQWSSPSIPCSPGHVQQPHPPVQSPHVCTRVSGVGTSPSEHKLSSHFPVHSLHNWDSYSWLFMMGQSAKLGWFYACTAQIAFLWLMGLFREEGEDQYPWRYLHSALMICS